MKRAIFISYRRDDTEGEAGRLYDDLTQAFREAGVFMDVDGITPGMDFRKAIDENVSACGVLLAVIGKEWTTVTSNEGHRRLDEPSDFVRLEIAAALQRNIPVIPVLVHGAQMPPPDQLPDSLKDLAYRNGVEITHARWNSDVQLLIKALQNYVAPGSESDTHTVHAALPVQLPPPASPAQDKTPPPKQPHWLAIAIGAAAVIAVAIGVILYVHRKNLPGSTTPGVNAGQSAITPAATVQPASSPGSTPSTSGAVDKPASAGSSGASLPLHANLYVGTWENPEPEANNGIARLQISIEGNHLAMHAWGNCRHTPCNWRIVPCDVDGCDWGTQPGIMDVDRLQGTFKLRQRPNELEPTRTAVVSVKPQSGSLDVKMTNLYANLHTTMRQFFFYRAK